jgi:hypothetical protein
MLPAPLQHRNMPNGGHYLAMVSYAVPASTTGTIWYHAVVPPYEEAALSVFRGVSTGRWVSGHATSVGYEWGDHDYSAKRILRFKETSVTKQEIEHLLSFVDVDAFSVGEG